MQIFDSKTLKEIQNDIKLIATLHEGLSKNLEDLRSWYKHQNSYTDELSETIIVGISNQDNEYEEILNAINDLIDYEEDRNN